MAPREKRDYLDDLDKPSLEAGRRLALILLSYVRDVENISAYASEPIDFEREVSRFTNSFECLNCSKEIDIQSPLAMYCTDYCQQVAGTIRYVRRGRVGKGFLQPQTCNARRNGTYRRTIHQYGHAYCRAVPFIRM